MKRMILMLAIGGLIGCVLPLAGCGGVPKPPRASEARLDAETLMAFAPASIEISPLTRVEAGVDGSPELAVYFRLLDSWGHGTKAPAFIEVQLFRVSVAGVAEGRDTWRWSLDLSDPLLNSSAFDVTGLYRITMTGLPSWVITPERADEVMRIRVYVQTFSGEGEEVLLRDVYDAAVTAWTGE